MDVEYFHSSARDPVEDFVRVLPDDLNVNARMRCALRTQRMFCDLGDCVVNCINDVAGSAWAALI